MTDEFAGGKSKNKETPMDNGYPREYNSFVCFYFMVTSAPSFSR